MAGVDRVVSLLRLCAGIIGPQVLDPGLPQLNKPQLHAGHRVGYRMEKIGAPPLLRLVLTYRHYKP